MKSIPLPDSALGNMDEFLRAYNDLRITQQMDYTNLKIKPPGKLFKTLMRQRSVLSTVGLTFISALLAIHLMVAIGFVVSPLLAIVHNPWIPVIAIWIAIFALAARALEGA